MRKISVFVFILVIFSSFVLSIGNDEHTTLLLKSNNSDGSTEFENFAEGNSTTTTISISGQTHHETDHYYFGQSSMYFDGNEDYLTFSSSSDWSFGTDNFTIDFWIRPGADSQWRGVMSSNNYAGGSSSTGWSIRFYDQTDKMCLNLGSVNYVLSSSDPIDLNSWSHVALTREGNVLRFYIDGMPSGSTTYSGSINGEGPLRIGHSWLDFTMWYWQGFIDELRISKGIARIDDPYDFMFDPERDGFDVPSKPYFVDYRPENSVFNTSFGSTDFSEVFDLTNVSGLVLADEFTKIRWNGFTNVNTPEFEDFFKVEKGFVSVDVLGLDSSINSSANISFEMGDCSSFDREFLSYRPGFFSSKNEVVGSRCPDDVCTDIVCEDGFLNFSVPHFSGYAYGVNSNLSINDSGELSQVFVNESVSFFAFYENETGVISDVYGQCNISVPELGVDDTPMVYDNVTEDWEYFDASGFDSPGMFEWWVNCSSDLYSDLSANDTIEITLEDSDVVPEFSEYGLMIALIFTIGFFLYFRKNSFN